MGVDDSRLEPPEDLQQVAEKHAPCVVLDVDEELWPSAAESYIGACDLVWVDRPGQVRERISPVVPARLGGSNDPYSIDLAPQRAEPVSSVQHTRAFDSRGRSPKDLPLTEGWALQLRGIRSAVGAVSSAESGDEYGGAPAYYEWTSWRGKSYLTYWFCYAGSALPWAIAVALQGVGFPEDRPAPEEMIEPPFDPLLALARSHPDLYRAAARSRHEYTAETGELVMFRDPVEATWGWLKKLLFEEAPTLWEAKDNPYFLCHQGDWESLTLELDPSDPLRPPRAIAIFQHGQPQPLPLEQAETQDGHIRVYSARGSHATLPHPAPQQPTANGDLCTAGRLWRTWTTSNGLVNLHDATKANWYGFGGAWGAVGSHDDLTGPLGPSRWKNPFAG